MVLPAFITFFRFWKMCFLLSLLFSDFEKCAFRFRYFFKNVGCLLFTSRVTRLRVSLLPSPTLASERNKKNGHRCAAINATASQHTATAQCNSLDIIVLTLLALRLHTTSLQPPNGWLLPLTQSSQSIALAITYNLSLHVTLSNPLKQSSSQSQQHHHRNNIVARVTRKSSSQAAPFP